MAQVASIILRFRDLVTQPGATILEHRAIIKNRGSTWWGWWNKAYERVPVDVFRHLEHLAVNQNLQI